MRFYEILEYMTKQGQEITFKYDDDSEGDDNRGWQIYRIDAFVNGEHAGYLKISNIPRERFERYYPTVLNYMAMIGGRTGVLPFDKRDAHYRDLDNEELRIAVRNLSYRNRKYNELWATGEGIPDSREGILAIIEDIIKNDLDEYHKKFKDFEEYHVDNPFVDYIRVFSGELLSDKTEKSFQRQGIGTALYLEGAKYLKKKGLMLRASGLQTDEARAIWKYLESKNLTKKIGKYRYIDPTKV